MGAGALQTLEGLVQNRNDPPLFLQRREGNGNTLPTSRYVFSVFPLILSITLGR